MAMSEDGFCPHCGAVRQSWAKFCGSCGKPYDAPAATAPAPPPPPADGVGFAAVQAPTTAAPVAKKGGGALRPILIFLVVGALGGLGYTALQNQSIVPSLGGGPTSANLPPAGVVWFGASFDSTSFAIRSQTSTGSAGQTFALVAHLRQTTDMSNANLRISLDGTTYVNRAVGLSGSGDVFGMTYTPPVAGTYRFDVADVGGTVLATGTIVVR